MITRDLEITRDILKRLKHDAVNHKRAYYGKVNRYDYLTALELSIKVLDGVINQESYMIGIEEV